MTLGLTVALQRLTYSENLDFPLLQTPRRLQSDRGLMLYRPYTLRCPVSVRYDGNLASLVPGPIFVHEATMRRCTSYSGLRLSLQRMAYSENPKFFLFQTPRWVLVQASGVAVVSLAVFYAVVNLR
jgi:hypothetical protein